MSEMKWFVSVMIPYSRLILLGVIQILLMNFLGYLEKDIAGI